MTDLGTITVDGEARQHDRSVEVTLWLRIPEDAHIETHEPSDPLLIPTVVDFEDLDVTEVAYPEPVAKDLGLPGPPLLVYEGCVGVTARGRADGTREAVEGTIRYQPCVGGACLPPRQQRWRVPLRRRPRFRRRQ